MLTYLHLQASVSFSHKASTPYVTTIFHARHFSPHISSPEHPRIYVSNSCLNKMLPFEVTQPYTAGQKESRNHPKSQLTSWA
jgi:hypothetical protein